MSLQELERDILKLPAADRTRLTAWINSLPPDVPEYPSQEREQMPEGYIGSPTYQEAIKALDEGFKDFEEGRYSTLAEWDKRFRARHNIPDNVEPFTPEELEAFEREMDALP